MVYGSSRPEPLPHNNTGEIHGHVGSINPSLLLELEFMVQTKPCRKNQVMSTSVLSLVVSNVKLILIPIYEPF